MQVHGLHNTPATYGVRPTPSAPAAKAAVPAEAVVADQVGSLPSGFRLVCGDLKFEIPAGRHVSIGRQADSDLCLTDGQVSRNHALLHSRHGQVQICDRGSSNGTFMNGERLKPNQWYVVKPGATLAMGETRLKLDGTGSTASPPEALAQQGMASAVQAAQGGVSGLAGFVLKDSLGRQFTLSQEGQYSLGRRQDNSILFSDMLVSGQHALLQIQDGQVALKDLNSTNGSFVNGQRIAPDEWVKLEQGALIRLGGVDLELQALLRAQPAPALDLQSKEELQKVVDFRELVADPKKQLEKRGQLVPDKPVAYWQNNAEARLRIRQYLDGGQGSAQGLKACLQEAHKLAVEGSSGTNRYYTGRRGDIMGPDDLPGGQFHQGVIGGVRNAESNLVEALAKQYGDPYRNDQDQAAPAVQLRGIAPEGQPQNMPMHGGQRHFYPSPGHFDQYFDQMQQRLDRLAKLPPGASKDEVLQNIAEFYQYGANVRPFANVNNSLFMNFTNELLRRHGMEPVYHGILDHAAHRLQPDSFNRYFKDWVQGEGKISRA